MCRCHRQKSRGCSAWRLTSTAQAMAELVPSTGCSFRAPLRRQWQCHLEADRGAQCLCAVEICRGVGMICCPCRPPHLMHMQAVVETAAGLVELSRSRRETSVAWIFWTRLELVCADG